MPAGAGAVVAPAPALGRLDLREALAADDPAVGVADGVAGDEQVIDPPPVGLGGLGGEDTHHQKRAVDTVGEVGGVAEGGHHQVNGGAVDLELTDLAVGLRGAGDGARGLVRGQNHELALAGLRARADDALDRPVLVLADENDVMGGEVDDGGGDGGRHGRYSFSAFAESSPCPNYSDSRTAFSRDGVGRHFICDMRAPIPSRISLSSCQSSVLNLSEPFVLQTVLQNIASGNWHKNNVLRWDGTLTHDKHAV